MNCFYLKQSQIEGLSSTPPSKVIVKNNFPEVSLLGCKVTTGPLVMINECHCICKLKNIYYSTITVLVSLDVN